MSTKIHLSFAAQHRLSRRACWDVVMHGGQLRIIGIASVGLSPINLEMHRDIFYTVTLHSWWHCWHCIEQMWKGSKRRQQKKLTATIIKFPVPAYVQCNCERCHALRDRCSAITALPTAFKRCARWRSMSVFRFTFSNMLPRHHTRMTSNVIPELGTWTKLKYNTIKPIQILDIGTFDWVRLNHSFKCIDRTFDQR